MLSLARGYRPATLQRMAVPLTLSIVLLGLLVGLLAWLLMRSERRYAELVTRFTGQADEYSRHSVKLASDMTRNQPKYVDQMLSSLSRGITQVTDAVTESVKAVYAPVQTVEQQAVGEQGDVITPWYTAEGAVDDTDPTDYLLGGVQDPYSDNHQTGNNLITESGPEGFGLPADAVFG